MAKLFFYLGVLLSSFLFTGSIVSKTSKIEEVVKKEVVRENVKENDAQPEHKQN